jgi:hypothetical protein
MNGIADYHFSSYYGRTLHWAMNGRLDDNRHDRSMIDELFYVIGSDWDTKPLFNFAFEKSEEGLEIDDRIKIATKMIEDTDVIVVIGYSFATTNDVVDRQLFSAMNKSKRLKKIYIQTKDELATNIHARFELSPEKVNIDLIRSLDSFHVATEYLYDKKVLTAPTFHFPQNDGTWKTVGGKSKSQ